MYSLFMVSVCQDLEKVGSRYYEPHQRTPRLMTALSVLAKEDYVRLQEMPSGHLRVFLGERGRRLLRDLK